MATSNHQDGSPGGYGFESRRPFTATPQGSTGQKSSRARRWFKIVLFAVVLSGIYIAYNLSLMTMPGLGPVSRPARTGLDGAPFKLAGEKLQQQLIGVIQSQLVAFRNEDYSAAYGYAAADFKAQVSLAAFERMVKASFPQIARSRSAEYGIILENGETARVEVTIEGESGTRIHYQYTMHLEHGVWKIGSVNGGQPEKIYA